MRRTAAVKVLFGVLVFGVVILVAGREWRSAGRARTIPRAVTSLYPEAMPPRPDVRG